jgi:hypothetical protein
MTSVSGCLAWTARRLLVMVAVIVGLMTVTPPAMASLAGPASTCFSPASTGPVPTGAKAYLGPRAREQPSDATARHTGGQARADQGSPTASTIPRFVTAAEASTSAAGSTLSKLTGTIADSFEGGEYSEVTFGAGQTFSRAEAWSATGPGHFLGLETADTSGEAEQAYNLAKWDNPAQVMRTYGLTQDTTMYFGRVAGGEGYQALIPDEIDPADILQFISARPLP